jgi:hypothetical protein
VCFFGRRNLRAKIEYPEMHPDLPALAGKIERVLAVKPEYHVTHPSELNVVRALSSEELDDFALERGWRVVSRVGGRQIEFYKDAAIHFQPL